MQELRYRQVHLDFHTSGAIMNIGKKFVKEEFQNNLRKGHVNSITVFSKCHHGWSYHPTKVNEMHPHLDFDLLQAQIDACHEIKVNAPVYISAGLDEKEAIRHPEWIVRFEDESTTWVKDFTSEAGFHLLCFNTSYLELLIAQLEEVMQNYNPDGIFLDISAPHPCYCAKCRNAILARGKDPRDREAVMEQAEITYANYAKRVEKTIRHYSDTCTIFHNAGHITRGRRDLAYYNSHLELESLPTGGWGYDHFPMSAAYVMNLGMEYLGMTGKFHNTWGEFGGFKHPNALKYETSLSLAFGAKCSIGDQLHPLGNMNPDTYDLIGKAYQEVERKEPWCQNARNCCDIAILGDEAVNNTVSSHDIQRYADIGVNRMMLEGNYLYCFIDLEQDFTEYKLMILPDHIRLNEDLTKRLQTYLDQGGKILASGHSGIREEKDEFALDFGASYLGKNPCHPDYLVPDFDLTTGRTPHIMYGQGHLIEKSTGTQIASRENSYFNRDVYRFCSHQHTPNNPDIHSPAIIMTKNTAYIGWDIFTDYAKMGSLHLKETVVHVIDLLLKGDKTLHTNLPDRGVVTLTHQSEEDRYINHLLFAHTTIRGKFMNTGVEHQIEVIEDIVPLHDIKVTINLPKSPKRVYLAPQMQPLDYIQDGLTITYTVPEVNCHQMIIME